jgi:hypothetical protein
VVSPLRRHSGRFEKHARRLESMLVTLAQSGQLALVRAWVRDRVSIEDLYDHYHGQRLPELADSTAARTHGHRRDNAVRKIQRRLL